MGYVDDEIISQPDCWRSAAALAGTGAVVDALPRPGERVAVVGCGTSWFMAMAYAGLREAAGQGETDAFQASEFPPRRRYDRLVAITRSGTTTEVLDLLAALRATRATPTGTASSTATATATTVIVGDPDSPAARPAAELAGHAVIALPFADERSVVQTRFATSTLALLRAHLGTDVSALAADAEVAVRAPLPVPPGTIEQVTFLGQGWTVGLAQEAALKCREAAGFWAEAYPAMDYRHGPIAIAAPGRMVWAFGDLPDRLAEEVSNTGAAFVHSRTNGAYGVLGRWTAGRPALDPLADLILAQRFAVALAAGRGLDPDEPRNLTRSVVLT
ncbi:sugar isomerase [Solwaraspora sp. WMMD1047]|uniref:SIS domain-containing protein n=1 Tax=Solwaraspora sp. WMMD1047 TaxID=3016102 RepID=UPI0024180401|nr:sugar isomerase [Solwaraspora sp. WMMD1047]MDG4833720.1 sugar isomerase [Solwaraspora sp. WMMD1047]